MRRSEKPGDGSALIRECQSPCLSSRWLARQARVEASVARCLRTPPDAAKTPGLQVGLSNRLRGLSNRRNVVVCNYCCGPITAEPCRAKARPLHPRRSYFAPAQAHETWAWVEAPGTAPGSDRLITTAIYRHSRLAPAPPI